MSPESSHSNAEPLVLKYRTLLDVSESIVSHCDLAELLHHLADKLRLVVDFGYVSIVFYDPKTQTTKQHLLDSRVPVRASMVKALPLDQSPAGLALQTQQPVLLNRIEEETRFPELVKLYREHGVQFVYTVPLTSSRRQIGAIEFGSRYPQLYGESELEFLQEVARQVAIAVDNTLNFQSAQAAQQQLLKERDRLSLLLEVNNALVSNLNLKDLFMAISKSLRRIIHHDLATLCLLDSESNQLRLHALDFLQHSEFFKEGTLVPMEGNPVGLAYTSRQTVLRNRVDEEAFSSEEMQRARKEGAKSGCSVPLISRDRVLGVLTIVNRREDSFSEEDVELLTGITNQITIAVENALAFQSIGELKNKLAEEKHYLEEEIQTEYNFAEIIGQSAALKRILKQVETVAPTDSTILIQGETGTGKELIARAIHNLSERRERTMVKINCAAIPTGLLESELFGHEKGAFTGAVAQRIGRFELAHRGTLFLDEVGDIPLELQPKLLRVLQESEFERLGSSRTIRADVRLIAATNCDLAQMVEEKKFRGDLFYRLNVFPVTIPPLRERPEDISLLVAYFVQKYSRRMNKRIESVRTADMEALSLYHWHGNVRELENFIERAVILSKGSYLEVPLTELRRQSEAAHGNPEAANPARLLSLDENERSHIEEILRHTNGMIGGKGGAAEILGLPVSTLRSRMKKLGLK